MIGAEAGVVVGERGVVLVVELTGNMVEDVVGDVVGAATGEVPWLGSLCRVAVL